MSVDRRVTAMILLGFFLGDGGLRRTAAVRLRRHLTLCVPSCRAQLRELFQVCGKMEERNQLLEEGTYDWWLGRSCCLVTMISLSVTTGIEN